MAGGAQSAINELSDAGKEFVDEAQKQMRSTFVFSATPPEPISVQQQSVAPPAVHLHGLGGGGFGRGGQPSYGGKFGDSGFGGGQSSNGGFGGGVFGGGPSSTGEYI